MKYRHGFVSNSSSTSFYCQICSREFELLGDASALEADMYKCNEGHEFDISCLPEGTRITLEEQADKHDFSLDCFPSEFCPICSLDIVPKFQLMKYIEKTTYLPMYEEEIRERFSCVEDLNEFLRDE